MAQKKEADKASLTKHLNVKKILGCWRVFLFYKKSAIHRNTVSLHESCKIS